MNSVVLTTNQISTGTYEVGADELLQIAAGVSVVGEDGLDDGIALSGVTAGGQINVGGYVGGADDGIDFIIESGDELISVGPTGSVVGNFIGTYLYNYNEDVSLSQTVDNSGYIYGGQDGLYLENAATQITNSGRIVGGATGIYVDNKEAFRSTTIVNDASGVISGATAIDTYSQSVEVLNAGEISATAATGGVLVGNYAIVTNSGNIEGADDTIAFGFGGSLQNSGEISSANQGAVLSQSARGNVENSGDIESHDDAVYFMEGDDRVQNSGTIAASDDYAIRAQGDDITIENSGVISATALTVYLDGTGGLDWIINEAGGVIEAQGSDEAIYVLGDAGHVINRGDLSGSVFASGSSTFTNTGGYSGQAEFTGGDVLIRNSGNISFDSFAGGVAAAVASVKSDTVEVSGENFYIAGVAGDDDRFVNAGSGVINDPDAIAIYHGSAGTFRLVNRGEIYGDIDLYGSSTVVNAGTLGGELNFDATASLFINRDLLDGDVTFSGTGNIYRGYLGSVTGTIYGAGADGRYFGGDADDTFDMTASGAKLVSGGAGDDTFIFTASGLNVATVVRGGAGDDTLTFSTAGTIAASAFKNVTSIETINLGNGANSLTVPDSLASSAGGGALTINGNVKADTINVSGVTNAADVVTIYGGLGQDQITAGGGEDIFQYKAASESGGASCDTIIGANLNVDRFDVSAFAGAIAGINTAVTTGTLSTSTFASDLQNDLPAAKLGAHDAVLFTASAGTLAGQTYLVVDANGVAGYQSSADLVIHLTGQTGTLTKADFI